MNPGKIWWTQIGNSLRFVDFLVQNLRDCRPTVLQVPRVIPWEQEFYQAIDFDRSAFSGVRRLRRLEWDSNTDPGEFVLRELCDDNREGYWPGDSYAEFLGSQEGIVLNDYYVWIRNIQTERALSKWIKFVKDYDKAARGREQRAVFFLEFSGDPVRVSGMENICYCVESYDCRIFCLEYVPAVCKTTCRSYLAELALCIGGGEPEVCAALLEQAEALLHNHVGTAQSVLQAGCFSDGRKFPQMSDAKIESAAWRAAIVMLFPILEQYRMGFIAAHKKELAQHLPITNSHGDVVTEPEDLEIGSIFYIVSRFRKNFTAQELEQVSFCRDARNELAHNRPLPYESVEKLFALNA